MAVYVDDMAAPFGRMKMSHMIADSTHELLTIANLIGVKHRWLQKSGTHGEHFDICQSKRQAAIERGAIPITMRELGRKLLERRRSGLVNA